MYTASTAILEALVEAGVEYLFANFGSDHPGLIEAIAQARAANRPCPKVITAPTEMVAMSAAHGFAQARGRAQAVLVHVDCGTQALGGAVHNAAKGRVPVLIIAGMSPATQEGEARGSRNEFIQWIQDVPDQRGLVRGYVRYENEIRVGANAKQIVHRALQFAHSEPRGPVYVTAPREVLESEVPRVTIDTGQWQPVAPQRARTRDAAREIAGALAAAEHPLIVTSYLGRSARAVQELVALAEAARRRRARVRSEPHELPDHASLLPGRAVERAPAERGAGARGRRAGHRQRCAVDRRREPAARRRAHLSHRCRSAQAADAAVVHRRDACSARRTRRWRCRRSAPPARNSRPIPKGSRSVATASRPRMTPGSAASPTREQPRDELTAEYLVACIRDAIGEDAIVVSESVTNFHVVSQHMRRTKPGTLFSSGGGSLGYNGGAAFGIKLAKTRCAGGRDLR